MIESNQPPFCQTDVGSSISLSTIKFRSRKKLLTENIFFDNNVRCKVLDDKIVFENVGNLSNDKTLKITKQKRKYQTTIDIDCEDGVYDIDKEESTIDTLVVYYR
jgi:hypothetical protein|tara:strand:+ start:119 stop:433 length:315 start_codon:yes stop_codon:yes gene_type:complete